MIRLFTALSLPEDLRPRLAALGGGIDGARWVAADNLHITLRFIGEVSEPVADDIVHALDRVRRAPLSVSLSGAGHFASRGRTRAVWIGVEKSPDLSALRDRIAQALIRIGLPPEGRKYTPHVTIGRLRDARPNRVLSWLEANGAFFAPPFEVRQFVLYESRLGRNGPAYTPVAEYPLSG
ncbi:MAG: RNA 2',3'-cyclic phosphodiesterase [Alphaproteobacteria bacterium]